MRSNVIIALILVINQVQATFFPFTWQPPRPAITYNIIAGGQRRPYPTGNTYRLRTIPPPPPPHILRGSPQIPPQYALRLGGGIPPRPISNPFDIGLPYTFPRPNPLDQYYGAPSYENDPYGQYQSIPDYLFRSPYAFPQAQPPFEHEENPFVRSPHPEARHHPSLHPGFDVRSPPIAPPSNFIRPPFGPPPATGF